ncbi:MAG: sigma-70 family RNA polymerase sigma factor [Gemmatimonadota bacterium]|nr:sigma-70 family RNA polymerase sigma factor [Gemmatimonadota bacterium]
MSELSDATVVARVLSGDREAFGTLVDRHQDRMLAYVRHMGFGPDEASDIVQDGFVRAFRHLGRCGDPERFDGWLFRIVSNLCRTAGGRAKRKRTDALEDHAPSLASELPGPDERMEGSWTRQRVREGLDGVPADQREALILMYLEGYSVAEIEEVTGASRSAVKMRLKRGRDVLERLLAPVFAEVEDR